VGINFIGGRWSEPTLLKLAYGFEQGTRVRHAPRFLPSLGVRDFIPRDTNARKGRASAAARAHTGRRTRTEPPKSQQKLTGL
jgi:amidase